MLSSDSAGSQDSTDTTPRPAPSEPLLWPLELVMGVEHPRLKRYSYGPYLCEVRRRQGLEGRDSKAKMPLIYCIMHACDQQTFGKCWTLSLTPRRERWTGARVTAPMELILCLELCCPSSDGHKSPKCGWSRREGLEAHENPNQRPGNVK